MSEAAHPRVWRQSGLGFVKTTLVGGVVFLVPVLILVVLIAKGAELLRKLGQPLAAHLPVDTVAGVVAADIVVVGLLLVCCFLAGLLARVSFANRFVKGAEAGVLWRLPGYGFIKGFTESLDHSAAASSMRPVMIHFDDAAQVGFEVDRLSDGRRVVYVPGAPDPRAGSVLIMDDVRVEAAQLTYLEVVRAHRTLGRGLGASLTLRGEDAVSPT